MKRCVVIICQTNILGIFVYTHLQLYVGIENISFQLFTCTMQLYTKDCISGFTASQFCPTNICYHFVIMAIWADVSAKWSRSGAAQPNNHDIGGWAHVNVRLLHLRECVISLPGEFGLLSMITTYWGI